MPSPAIVRVDTTGAIEHRTTDDGPAHVGPSIVYPE
jgi:hypothetical protein